MVALRSTDTSLSSAVAETLAAVPYDKRDAALRRLIERYAALIDANDDLEHLGARLLSSLEALQATPRARKNTEQASTGPNPLEAFRSAAG